MKKTINISIGGLSFQIEEEAYATLEKYLSEVKARFASYPDAGEIVSDMEDRIAEQFSAKAQTGRPISPAMVQELISVMGRPDQIGEAGKNDSAPNQEAVPKAPGMPKRLFRNLDDAILGGVCSGLAVYLGTDTAWVRLIFALTIFFGGFGIVLYLILWIIVPAAETDTEKLQMRGSPINLKNLEQTVRDRVAEIKKKDPSTVKRALAAPFKALGLFFRGLGRVLQSLLPVLFKIIGVGITVVAAMAMAGLVFAAVSLLTNSGSPYVDFPLKEIASGAVYYAAVASAFFVAFVPIVFILLLGTSLVAYRSTFKRMGSFMLLGLWVVAVAVFVNMAVKLAPQVEDLVKTSPYFQTASKEYALRDFSALEIGGVDEAVIHPGSSFKVVAEARQKDLDETRVFVQNGTLKVGHERLFKICLFCTRGKVKLSIYAPSFDRISASGASRVTTVGQIQGAGFKTTLSGVASLEAEAKTPQMEAELSGASKLFLSGTADSLQLSLSGVSNVKAESAQIKSADINLSGASEARFGTLESLKVEASGASVVYYQSATSLQEHYSGAAHSSKRVPSPSDAKDREYQNLDYNFKFNYPAAYLVSDGPAAGAANAYYLPIQTYFFKAQTGRFVVTASLPKETYPANTDFDGAFFSVAVTQELSQAECLKYNPNSGAGSQGTETVRQEIINGVAYTVGDASGAGMSHQAYGKIYHTYKNGSCYELQTGVRTSGFGAADFITEQVNVEDVQARLNNVLRTFTFLK